MHNRAAIAAVGLLAASWGCAGGSAITPPPGPPLVVGPIESIDHRATASGILVRANPGSIEGCGIAATADADTRYLRRTDAGSVRQAERGDLAVGAIVEVYVSGPVAESCPVQGYADAFVLLSDGS